MVGDHEWCRKRCGRRQMKHIQSSYPAVYLQGMKKTWKENFETTVKRKRILACTSPVPQQSLTRRGFFIKILQSKLTRIFNSFCRYGRKFLFLSCTPRFPAKLANWFRCTSCFSVIYTATWSLFATCFTTKCFMHHAKNIISPKEWWTEDTTQTCMLVLSTKQNQDAATSYTFCGGTKPLHRTSALVTGYNLRPGLYL